MWVTNVDSNYKRAGSLLGWQGQADQENLHNLEEETEMDEKIQTRKYVHNLPHAVSQIPLERLKETNESNIERKSSSSTCHLLTLIPNSESACSYRHLSWCTVLTAASLPTCLPFPSRPEGRFPWATCKNHWSKSAQTSLQLHTLPVTVAKPSQNGQCQQRCTAIIFSE